MGAANGSASGTGGQGGVFGMSNPGGVGGIGGMGVTGTPTGPLFGGLFNQMQNQQRTTGPQLDAGIGDGLPTAPAQGDFYTAMNRPNYMEYGQNGQFYQPIYRPQYQNYAQPMGGVFGGYGMPMGMGMGMGMRGMPPAIAPQDAPVYNTTPTVTQSGGIGSGGAMNYTYAKGGIADLLE